MSSQRATGVRAYVALGSNLGDRAGYLRAALEELGATSGISVLRASAIYETAPVGPPQPEYLNAVVELEVCLSPPELLHRLLAIEAGLGRRRSGGARDEPRTVDLDLLWQGGLTLATAALTLPHPRLTERSFVLAPLAELAPELVIGGRQIREWLAARPADERAGVRPNHQYSGLLALHSAPQPPK